MVHWSFDDVRIFPSKGTITSEARKSKVPMDAMSPFLFGLMSQFFFSDGKIRVGLDEPIFCLVEGMRMDKLL